jgi:glycosyltransferase involved in cell wall biosynthesis
MRSIAERPAMLKVALATSYDARGRNRFAAKMTYRLQALGRHVDALEYLGPLGAGFHRPRQFAKWLFYRYVQGKRYLPTRDARLIASFGRQLAEKLAKSEANVVLSLEAPSSQPVAYLDCQQPIVIWSDATFAGTMATHPTLARGRLCQESLRDALANERAALARCRLAVYLSDWAAESAIGHYDLDPAKVTVVPGGANLDAGLAPAEVEAIVANRPSDRCNLLFIAQRWQDKGGEIAIEVARALNQFGLRATLTVVGARPEGLDPLPPFVRPTGMLRKSVPDELTRLQALLRQAHFLILPTRAEAFGFVFCEASAYAVPSLATEVGGVPTAVLDGRNGKLFPLDAGPDAYCAYIDEMLRSPVRYRELARSSFNEYATRLNWDAAATAMRRHMLELVGS